MIDILTASDATQPRSPLHGLDLCSETQIVNRIADVFYAGDDMTDEQELRLRVILRAVVQHNQMSATVPA